MMNENTPPPKVFISYSWTSQQHQDWVTSLAEQLENPGGIEVVYDLWDLKPGQDKYAYMERMVRDPSISKVVIIADRRYKEKADSREGGVGTESVIISQEVYEAVEQEKFIALPTEVDEQGRPYLPIFMASRKYFDFSKPEQFYDRFEELVRYLHGKPLHRRPVRSRPPAYVLEEEAQPSRTRPRLRAFENALRTSSPTALGLLDDYLESVDETIGEFGMQGSGYEPEFFDEVVARLTAFLPTRNEFVDFIRLLAQYARGDEPYDRLHRFFERLTRYTVEGDRTADAIRFIVWELFLHTNAVLIRTERFAEAAILLRRPYFTPSAHRHDQGALRSFGVLDPTLDSVDRRSPDSGLYRKEDPRGKILRERTPHPSVPFHELVQTDFVLGVRGALHRGDSSFDFPWYPRLLSYAHNQQTFELFLRAASREFFQRMKPLLGIGSVEELATGVERSRLPPVEGIWGDERYQRLLNLEHLATR